MEFTLIIGGDAVLVAAEQAVRDANNEFERAIAVQQLVEARKGRCVGAQPEGDAIDPSKPIGTLLLPTFEPKDDQK